MIKTLACLMAVLPVVAWSADNPDKDFFKQAAEGGIAEVEAGKLAESKGSSQAVKDFGAMMVKDHSAANKQLEEIASTKSVDLPGHSGAAQMAKKAKLEVLTGDTFDKSYIKDQLSAHEQTVALFKKEIASGTDPEAKSFAKETLPTLRVHLKKIEEIAAEAGVTAKH
ncbi:MAG: DUF4142 domain-containing protein [Proteobacteria bacterium]|nr:DUF4142 domain-containing protein [Pseudomonadota bacterium]